MTKQKKLDQGVLERLLLAKNLLSEIRYLNNVNPDSRSLAKSILLAHDGCELAFAGIAQHLKCIKYEKGKKYYLWDYIDSIDNGIQEENVLHRSYFSDLNEKRNALKHKGDLPAVSQWRDIGRLTYDRISENLQQFAGYSLDALDESVLIKSDDLKTVLGGVKEAIVNEDFRKSFEILAFTLWWIFKENYVFNNIIFETTDASYAIRLAPYGINTNDYLELIDYLPSLKRNVDTGKFEINWNQEKFGHPGNWKKETAEFCLKTVTDIALRIQDTSRILRPIEFSLIYEHQITALINDVEVYELISKDIFKPSTKKIVQKLQKGAKLTGSVSQVDRSEMHRALAPYSFTKPTIHFWQYEQTTEATFPKPSTNVYINLEEVKIKCVPRQLPWVKEHFPDLPELDWEPTY